jgi:hypothetical protein
MGRPKTPKIEANVAPEAQVPENARKYKPLPPKGNLKALAKHRKEFSPKLLGNRIATLSVKDRKQFARFAKLTERHVLRLGTTPETPQRIRHPPECKEKAQAMWEDLVEDQAHKATSSLVQ